MMCSAPRLTDVLVLFDGLRFEVGVDPIPSARFTRGRTNRREEVDELASSTYFSSPFGDLLGDFFVEGLLARHVLLALPPSRMRAGRPAMLVAMVMAPLRPALRDDLGFPRVYYSSVEHDVLGAALLEACSRHARTFRSTQCRPAGTARFGGLRCRRRSRPTSRPGAVDQVGSSMRTISRLVGTEMTSML